MTTQVIGTTFDVNSQWSQDEKDLVATVKQQIEQHFPTGKNLLINLTWFGPQFANGEYDRLLTVDSADRVFFLASVDAPMLNQEQFDSIKDRVGARESYSIGTFDTEYQFSFICTVIDKYFHSYTNEELRLREIHHRYLAYNRKPRTHRVQLVKQLLAEGLDSLGVVTLGDDTSGTYNQIADAPVLTLGEQPTEFAGQGNWNEGMRFGIAMDIHSLGNPEIWRHSFLHISSETEFNPWDPMHLTEKTWKPILGLRPFIINGQTKIYRYLRDHGFKTFTHYFPGCDLETEDETAVVPAVLAAIRYIAKLTDQELLDMYDDMWPALVHNQQQFKPFVEYQRYRIQHIFDQ